MKGKNALITGSARGIGKSIALVLAKHGVNIIINDIMRMKDEAEKTVEELTSLGVKAAFIPADVSNFDEVNTMMVEIQEKFQNIHFLINNAGILKDRTLKKMTPEEWSAVINVNLNSIYNVTHLALPLIPDGGKIVSVSSVAGIGGNFGQCNYAATKAGIVGFTKSLAKELGKNKINVNAIAPGFIKSDMTDNLPFIVKQMVLKMIPFEEMGTSEDVANVVKFLCSDDAKYVNGQVIRIDGGLAI